MQTPNQHTNIFKLKTCFALITCLELSWDWLRYHAIVVLLIFIWPCEKLVKIWVCHNFDIFESWVESWWCFWITLRKPSGKHLCFVVPTLFVLEIGSLHAFLVCHGQVINDEYKIWIFWNFCSKNFRSLFGLAFCVVSPIRGRTLDSYVMRRSIALCFRISFVRARSCVQLVRSTVAYSVLYRAQIHHVLLIVRRRTRD